MYHVATKHAGFRARASDRSRYRWLHASALLFATPRLILSRSVQLIRPSPSRHIGSLAVDTQVEYEGTHEDTRQSAGLPLNNTRALRNIDTQPAFGSLSSQQDRPHKSGSWAGQLRDVAVLGSVASINEDRSVISRLAKPRTTRAQDPMPDAQADVDLSPQVVSHLEDEARAKLDLMSKAKIYAELRVMPFRNGGNVRQVQQWCQYLVQDRAEPPNLEMFRALILTNLSAGSGSARYLKKILQEMGQYGIALTASACHDVLKVLAVHPDFLMASDMLEYMQSRWLTLTPAGHRDLLLIYLRSAQTEMALEKLDYMLEEGIPVQQWLFDVVIYHLCYFEEHDEVLRLLQMRTHDGEDTISLTMWGVVLDLAAKESQSELVSYIWEHRVKLEYLHPPSGVCLNVMLSAVRQGNVELATEVFSMLAARGVTFDHSHYDLLTEAYLQASDLQGALSLLCVMQESRVEPDANSTSMLLRHLTDLPDLCSEAFDILRQAREEDGRAVPLAAVNTVLDAMMRTGQLSEAVEAYKRLKTVVPSGPSVETINHLLRGCADSQDAELALSLAAEMPILGLHPDATTYTLVISSLIRAPSNRRKRLASIALSYYNEARAQSLQLELPVLAELTASLSLMGKHEAMDLFSDLEQMGYDRVRLENLRNQMQRHTLSRLKEERKMQKRINGGNHLDHTVNVEIRADADLQVKEISGLKLATVDSEQSGLVS